MIQYGKKRNFELRVVGKATDYSVKSALLKGLPDNGFSSASNNMTQSTSKCVLASSQSLSSVGSKLAALETKVGAGYGVGSATGMEAATKACTSYDL